MYPICLSMTSSVILHAWIVRRLRHTAVCKCRVMSVLPHNQVDQVSGRIALITRGQKNGAACIGRPARISSVDRRICREPALDIVRHLNVLSDGGSVATAAACKSGLQSFAITRGHWPLDAPGVGKGGIHLCLQYCRELLFRRQSEQLRGDACDKTDFIIIAALACRLC